jgi:hypothetical protein
MDNITITQESTLPPTPPVNDSTTQQGPDYKPSQLASLEITSEVVALNVMVSFLNVAQKRGAFSIDESAKIWECIQKFIVQGQQQGQSPPSN